MLETNSGPHPLEKQLCLLTSISQHICQADCPSNARRRGKCDSLRAISAHHCHGSAADATLFFFGSSFSQQFRQYLPGRPAADRQLWKTARAGARAPSVEPLAPAAQQRGAATQAARSSPTPSPARPSAPVNTICLAISGSRQLVSAPADCPRSPSTAPHTRMAWPPTFQRSGATSPHFILPP